MLGAALLSCTGQGAATSSPLASPSLHTQAGDLRTHLDLLLSEHAMIVAKESAAAVNHSDQYASYTTLLATNSADLSGLIASAYGTTTAAQFAQVWNSQNAFLVDYAIGVVTHNDIKAVAAMSALTGSFAPQFAQLVNAMSRLPLDQVTLLMRQQIQDDKAFIDDVFAGDYANYYVHVDRAYAQTTHFGDALATEIALKFPDKFPGDPFTHGADVHVSLSNLLQEHSYLATMATDAAIAGRTAESTAGASALAGNGAALAAVFAASIGPAAGSRFTEIWTVRDNALLGYAVGTSGAKQVLTEKFVTDFTALAHIDKPQLVDQVNATIKVIDDQRAKSSKTVANDDRAAATAMQPVADSIQG